MASPRERLPQIGLGAGSLGDPSVPEDRVARLLDLVLEQDRALIDMAPSYGIAEDRVGRLLGARRSRVVLSTKLGYGVPGVPDWTGETIRQGIDLALRRLRTDHLELVFLHSCPPETLERDDILRALQDARDAGKIGHAGYSGDGDGLRAAKSIDVFDAFQVSHNLVDQAAIHAGFDDDTMVLGKRTLMNAVFAGPVTGGPDKIELRRRFEQLEPMLRAPAIAGGVATLALRFAAFSEGVDTVLVGTSRPENFARALAAADEGPLPSDVLDAIERAWQTHRWPGLI